MPPDPRSVVEQRARDAIDFPAERLNVEFKRNADFETLKLKIAKTSMAMANLRDGGMMIIGVAQNQQREFVVEGVDAGNEATFVQDPVSDFVSNYASPAVELRVLPLEHQVANQAKRFIVIDVQPFERTPVVCKRPTPEGTPPKQQMRVGDFYVRTGSPVSTQRVQSDAMMHEVLEIAVQRRLAEFERTLRGAGLTLVQSSSIAPDDAARREFDAEVQDLGVE